MNIIGVSQGTQSQAERWARDHGATAEFIGLAALYWSLASAHGDVRADVAFAQAAHETGFGHFGGVINASFHNPCGLKNHGNGSNTDPNAHHIFKTWRLGVMAHLDHLALYAGAPGYPRADSPDPRHFPSIKGVAKTVEELGNKWNDGNPDYGKLIVSFVSQIMKEKGDKPVPPTPVPSKLKVIPRSGWGARPPKNPSIPMSLSTPEGIFVHYTGSDSDEQADHKNCPKRVLGIQSFHQGPSRGWNDIAYSFVVCKHGIVYEGRGWGVQGAHTLGYNSRAHAVVFLGNDSTGRDDVTDEGRAALAAVINESFRLGGAHKVRGHRDVNATDCPGDELWHWVHTNGWADEPVPPAKPDGFWKWLNWYEGTGSYAQWGPKAPGHRPDVLGTISDAWWTRRKAAIERRALRG